MICLTHITKVKTEYPVHIVCDCGDKVAWINGVEVKFNTLGSISLLEKVLMILGHDVSIKKTNEPVKTRFKIPRAKMKK